MITSKITSKAQTTIPQAVRDVLGLRKGDKIVYIIEDRRVIMSKGKANPPCDPFTTFEEWNSHADRKAYADF
ncbi:MAG: type II toxin-antitoxin system PrlF family antitoxin [Hyphomicrobiales bacterium]|nr:type II toxin-antitoxin system PrlF family antitoxin [Hyphomicrobiales bacterium]MBV9519767.1 type II toxin-antitoxin system PrlF family antitoxin [Hyphomicrobiales bacterium]